MIRTAHCQHGLVDVYDRLAPNYDRLHRRWLRHAGGEAQAALEAVVRTVFGPDSKLLDVGCGTGAFARALIAEGFLPGQMTLVDPSPAMRAHCADIPVQCLHGQLYDLPFSDAAFDIVTCAWVLETLPELSGALHELCRVLKPGGVLCLAFCADKPARGTSDWLMCQSLSLRGTGRFLCCRDVVHQLSGLGDMNVRVLPTAGPTAAVIARRGAKTSSSSKRSNRSTDLTDTPPILDMAR